MEVFDYSRAMDRVAGDEGLLRELVEIFFDDVGLLVNAGIFEGDVVIVTPTTEAFNGQTVVAMIDDEVTVKVFHKKNNKILLIPENDKYQPIEVEKTKDFKLVGKVVGLVRRFN